ncbi:MAG: protein kinase [Kofleriaceae bacterium]
MAGDDWKPTVPERPSSRDPKAVHDDASPPPEVEPLAPALSGRYVGGAEIARGGMGRVIEATDTVLARTVAVKEALTSDPETLRRFARETRITARLEHPSIVPVYDAGTDPDAPFYVMRRVTGRPLSGLIATAATLDDRLALIPHVLACAQAIAHAHKRGVIHRDIKPNNILVGELGETVVIDWGIAKVIGESDDDDALPPLAGDSLRTRIGTVSGTPGFMSPEQARGDELGPAADIWALGATLYYLLARQMPHEAHAKTPDDLLALAAHRKVPPIASLVAGVPPELAAITDRALAFEAADRFPDAAAFAEELSRFLTGQIVASHDYSMRERLVRWIKRYRAIVAVAVLAITVVAVVSAIAIRRVIAARERADAAAVLAEAARAKEQLHAQSELLARARAIATTRPTSAIAAIDQLPPGSPMTGEADAIFTTAISHGGAAWALARNSGPNNALALDPTATKVLQLTRSGLLQIWDLDRRELVVEKQLPERTYVAWTARGVVIYGSALPQILDVSTKQLSPFGSAALNDIVVSDDGTRVAAIDATHVAGWIDLATGTMTPVSQGPVLAIAIPGDGTWLAAQGEKEVLVHGARGEIILRRAVRRPWMIASRSKRLALLDVGTIAEVEVAPGAVWHEWANSKVVWPTYFGETLVGRSALGIQAFHDPGKPPAMITQIFGMSTNMAEVGSGMVSFTTGATAGELLYFDLVRTLTISLPEAFSSPRVASRRGSTRVVVSSTSMVLVLDLRYTLPRKRGDIVGHKARYVTDEHVIALEPGGQWVMHHQAKTKGPLDGIPLYAEVMDISQGRAMLADIPMSPTNLYVVDTARKNVFRVSANEGRLVAGGLVYRVASELWARGDDQLEGEKLADLPGDDMTIVDDDDDDDFYVLTRGEMLRGTIAAGIIERKPFVVPDDGVFLAAGGRLLIAAGKELRWDAMSGPLIDTFEDTISDMFRMPGGVVVVLASGVSMFVALGSSGTPTISHLASSTIAATNDTGRLIVTSPVGTEVIELPSRQRWVHPMKNVVSRWMSVRPSGTGMLELGADASWWEWPMPPAGLDVGALRHTATNAREQDDRVLLWPWQVNEHGG